MRLAEKLTPDVVLMDLIMPVLDGVKATKRIKERLPRTAVIVLTSYVQDEQIMAAIEAGAISYLLKTAKAHEIAAAIRSAVQGESRLDPSVATALTANMRKKQERLPHEELTDRELEVLRLLGEAKTNQEIADELYIGVKTVKTHVSNILMKLGLEDRTQAAIYAVKHGLVRN
ncbi:two-component response regulator (YvqE) responding to cell wall stress [[Clostridium] ultunense Esp]|nr:two-component response regulator (YvqE) responding to cell wall stress [[Clostridium] ultunense Esp]